MNSTLGKTTEIWAHELIAGYTSPPALNFLFNNGGPTYYVQGDITLTGYNVSYFAKLLEESVKQQSQWFRHNKVYHHIILFIDTNSIHSIYSSIEYIYLLLKVLIPFGGDVAHYNAFVSFDQMDQLMT